MSNKPSQSARSLKRLVSLPGLKGLYAHTVKNGKVEWQCLVKSEDPMHIIVVCFSWLDGRPNGEKRVRVEETANWVFFQRHEDFIAASNAVIDDNMAECRRKANDEAERTAIAETACQPEV